MMDRGEIYHIDCKSGGSWSISSMHNTLDEAKAAFKRQLGEYKYLTLRVRKGDTVHCESYNSSVFEHANPKTLGVIR